MREHTRIHPRTDRWGVRDRGHAAGLGPAQLGRGSGFRSPATGALAGVRGLLGVVCVHRGDLDRASRVDERGPLRQPPFLERTLVFLLFVSMIPWPTELAASHIREGGSAARAVAALYAAVMMLMGLSMAGSWRYLMRHEQLVVATARPAMAAGTRRALLGALAYRPALILAPLAPAVSLALDAVIAVYFAVSRSEVPWLVHAAALHGNQPKEPDGPSLRTTNHPRCWPARSRASVGLRFDSLTPRSGSKSAPTPLDERAAFAPRWSCPGFDDSWTLPVVSRGNSATP
jgi:hypothetical protein